MRSRIAVVMVEGRVFAQPRNKALTRFVKVRLGTDTVKVSKKYMPYLGNLVADEVTHILLDDQIVCDMFAVPLYRIPA